MVRRRVTGVNTLLKRSLLPFGANQPILRRMRTVPHLESLQAQEDRKRPTINDVARLSGVSKKTVSRVINKSMLVREETRIAVQAVIDEIGFRPDQQARALAFGRSFLIGLIYDNPNPQYVIDMQQGVLDMLQGTGFELLVHPCQRSTPGFLETVQGFVDRQRLAGVIMTPSVSEDDGLAALLGRLGCPYVRIASVLLDDATRSVVTQDSLGGEAAAHHLAGLGHSRIAHISGPDGFRSAHERRAGFLSGLATHGLSIAKGFDVRAAYTFESGVLAARKLLARPSRPTAIFCGNDEMAAGVYQAAREVDLRIGEDISLVGFDDSPLSARLWPPLTSVRLPIRDMGRAAARMLMGEVGATPSPTAPTTIAPIIVPALVVRNSTAPVG